MIELEVILIIRHRSCMQAFEAWVKSISSRTPHLRDDRVMIRQAAATYSQNLLLALQKIGMKSLE